MTANTNTDALRTITRAPLLRPSPLVRHRGADRREDHEHVALIATGGTGPDFNLVNVVGPEDPARVFAMADAFFGAPDRYCVVVESETAAPMERALQARGWLLDEDEPALVLTPVPDAIPPCPPDLNIRRVTDELALAHFFAVSGLGQARVPSLAAALDPDVAVFVGYVDGEPAATSRLLCLGDVGEIVSVVTTPAVRRRGYGTAMTWAAVAAGKARGCTAMTLTASAMGYPVYVRMGFIPVCAYRTYVPPASGV
jgi:ribosomal protein S18 acetylase RimI-like enzyme